MTNENDDRDDRRRTDDRNDATRRPGPVPGTAASRGEATGDRGQSSVVGVALMLSLVIVGAGVVVFFGGQAIADTQRSANIDRAEQAMTALDSDVAVVALGDAQTRRTSLGSTNGGQYVVREDTGWMRVTHTNHSGSGNVEELHNGTLGAVEYRNGDTTVAYQGGGVWRTDGEGSTMVSSPEFYYRGSTLTLPSVQIRGDDGAGGRTVANVRNTDDVLRKFPNSSVAYPDGEPYENPIRKGSVNVTVHSDYYEAWASYFRSRTTGNVTVDDANEQVTLQLVATDIVGDFQLPSRTNSLDINDIESGHSVDNFNVTLDRGNNYNNAYFSFYVEESDQEFEMLIYLPGGLGANSCNDGTLSDDNPDDLEMDLYYYNATTGDRHLWTNGSVTPLSGPVKMRCDGGEITVDIDYTSSQQLEYGSATTTNNDANWHFDWKGTLADPVSFDHSEHGEPTDFSSGDATSLDQLVNHYFALLGPDFDLAVDYGPGGSPRVAPDQSFGNLDYDRGDSGFYITFLHVTENRVRVSFE